MSKKPDRFGPVVGEISPLAGGFTSLISDFGASALGRVSGIGNAVLPGLHDFGSALSGIRDQLAGIGGIAGATAVTGLHDFGSALGGVGPQLAGMGGIGNAVLPCVSGLSAPAWLAELADVSDSGDSPLPAGHPVPAIPPPTSDLLMLCAEIEREGYPVRAIRPFKEWGSQRCDEILGHENIEDSRERKKAGRPGIRKIIEEKLKLFQARPDFYSMKNSDIARIMLKDWCKDGQEKRKPDIKTIQNHLSILRNFTEE